MKETNLTKRVIPYPALREADVMYVRRIWQDVDLRQKINQMFYFPVDPIEDRKNLFDVIRYALEVEGSLTAYGTGPAGDDDEFRYPLSGTQIDSLLNPVVIIPQFDPVTGEVIGSMEAQTTINSQDIVRYRLKEDWVWDRQRSQRHVRIIGIAPSSRRRTMKATPKASPRFSGSITRSAVMSSPTRSATTTRTTPNAGRSRRSSRSATSPATS